MAVVEWRRRQGRRIVVNLTKEMALVLELNGDNRFMTPTQKTGEKGYIVLVVISIWSTFQLKINVPTA